MFFFLIKYVFFQKQLKIKVFYTQHKVTYNIYRKFIYKY